METARERLFKSIEGNALSSQEALNTCREAVDNFTLNRLIFKELDYYRDHGEIFGEHPIFVEEVRRRKVDEMSLNEAHKNLRNIRTYISKEKRNLKNARSEKSRKKIQEKLDDWKALLKLIEEKIGASNE